MERPAFSNEAAAAARHHFGVARSGSVIELIGDADEVLVRKWSPSGVACQGFLRQRNKQSDFFQSQNRYIGITTPRVRGSNDTGGLYFDMDFVSYLPVSEQITTWSPNSVSRFIERLAAFLNVNASETASVIETTALTAKIDQILERTTNGDALSRYAISLVERARQVIPPSLSVPIGYEHGDLTFSNILSSHDGDKLVLIDFTMSPVETPLQDVAKLLQEVMFRWSWRNRELNNQEMARLDANLRHIRAHVCRSFEAEYSEALSWLTFLTIARILPYAQSAQDVAWVVDALETIDSEGSG